MIIPIRCFTCGKVVGDKSQQYESMVKEKIPFDEIYKQLGIQRYCCKRMLQTNLNI